MSEYITEINVSLNKEQENDLRSKGYIQNPVNLNKESTGAKIFMWYKKGSSPDTGITRIQLTFTNQMRKGLAEAGYTEIEKDLNHGTGGDKISLWYYKGSKESDVPFVDLFISTERDDEAQLFHLGWEKLVCNLNRRNGGCRLYLWVKRAQPTYICDIQATAGFQKDALLFTDCYIRVDENTSRAAGKSFVTIWYLLSKNSQNAIKNLILGDTNFKPPPTYHKLNQDLNQGTGGTPLFLFYTTVDEEKNKAIETMSLIVKKTGLEPYKKAGVHVIERSLNEGNEGPDIYVCFY